MQYNIKNTGNEDDGTSIVTDRFSFENGEPSCLFQMMQGRAKERKIDIKNLKRLGQSKEKAERIG